jgi:hypothetical protein
MSKGVKTVVAIAVAVAIPFVAPTIAASIGLSGVIGATAGSALVGAGLGAANASLTGGDVGRGALIGGLSGGIAGYNYTPTVRLDAPAPVYDVNAAGQVVPAPGYSTTAAATPGLSNVPTDALTAANATVDPIASLNASQNFTSVDPAYAQIGSEAATATQVADAATVANRAADFGTPAQMAAAAKTAPMSFTDAIKAVPGELKAKFSDPKALADMTLRAAGSIAGSLAAGDGMSDQEKQLLQAQTDELRALQVSNKALFDQKLQAAQDLIGESKYFDPEYFGLQRARKAQLAGAKAKRAGLRGLEGSRRASEERRFDLATGRDTGTAFDQGFGTGAEGRLRTMQAGLTAMPGTQTGYGSDYKNIYDQYAAADRRSKERAQGAGDLFGSFIGTSKARA